MCKQATCVLQSHIVFVSVLVVTLLLAMFGTWFEHEFIDGRSCAYGNPPPYVFRATMYHAETEYKCAHGTYATNWGDLCDFDTSDRRVCAMWRPSLTLHIVAFVLVICALSTASAQACGCCCVGTKTNLKCSLGFTISGFVNLLIAFIMFSLVKDSIDSDETEFDYAWGWVFSLLSVLMLLASVVLGCIASGQDVPVQNIGAPPAGQTVVVGKPVEGN
mmetsp:Transcript_31951/g.72903  ORF Transcript_31951/g.72903 Transcript_31951/m.72903 type:complete len:218 (+) Transcript_31951:59-712(+)